MKCLVMTMLTSLLLNYPLQMESSIASVIASTRSEPPIIVAGRVALTTNVISGNARLTGTIELAGAANVDLQINLSSSNQAAQISPASLTIPSGQRASTPFTITTTQVTQSTKVFLNARVTNAGLTPALQNTQITAATLTLEPAILKSISLSSARIVSSASEGEVKGAVEIEEPAPAGGVVVQLSLNQMSALSIRNNVTVKAGEKNAGFLVRLNPSVPIVGPHTITATLGSISKSVNLTAEPLRIVDLTIPASIVGGTSFNGSLKLNGHVLEKTEIKLTASPAPEVTFGIRTGQSEITLTIVPGADSGSFQASSLRVLQNTVVTIGAGFLAKGPFNNSGPVLTKTITVTRP